MSLPDDVRWFDAVGTCRCGKDATGKLMGSRNQSFGAYCRKCAEKRLRAAQRERDAAEQGRRLKAERDDTINKGVK
jgi:hypothetical protein